MGFFSFMTADTGRSISINCSESGPFPVAVLIPKEFGGGQIIAKCYDGYGDFGGYDIYELLAEWNRMYLTPENLEKPERDDYDSDEQGQEYFEDAMYRYEFYSELISDYKNGMSEKKLIRKYGDEWKRDLGTEVGADEDMREKLKYPLKIVEDLSLSYEDVVGDSKDCPYQGCC